MPLQSKLFKGDPALEACLIQDSAHVTEGAKGEHVAKIQTALFAIDGLGVSPDELRSSSYGKSTVKAVLAFKAKRNIINYTYERQVDGIVGKMTIAALDGEMLRKEAAPPRQLNPRTYSRSVS
jgi:peptidoglycan hydrolase-like protein with peptidoglycan-binding domain